MSTIPSGSPNTPITLEGVYYVESPNVPMGRLAIRPSFLQKQATWDDTASGMIVHLDASSPHWKEVSEKKPNALLEKIDLIFRKHQVTLRFLTLELYNEKLKSKVAGHPAFSSTEELQKYYLNTDFYITE